MTSFVFITGSPQEEVQFAHEVLLAQSKGEITVTDDLKKEMEKILVLSDGLMDKEELMALTDGKEIRELYHMEYETRPMRAIYRCEVKAKSIGHAMVLFWKEHPQSCIRAINHVYKRHGSGRNPGIQKKESPDSGEEMDISI